MKTIIFHTVFAAAVAVGPLHAALFDGISPTSVVRVVFGDLESERGVLYTNTVVNGSHTNSWVDWKERPLNPCFEVNAPKVISNLWHSLTPVPLRNEPDASITFSGVISYLFFLDSHSNVLARTMVVAHDAQVLASRPTNFFLRNDEIWCTVTNIPRSVALHRPLFCRYVIDLMRKSAPDRLAVFDKMHYQRESSLEQEVFCRASTHHLINTNYSYRPVQPKPFDIHAHFFENKKEQNNSVDHISGSR